MRIREAMHVGAGFSRPLGRLKAAPTYLLLVLAAFTAACATRTLPPPSLPATLKYPEFVAPAVPQALQTLPGAEQVDAGWRYLQNDDLGNAERQFDSALKRSPKLYPARAGQGYLALARQKYDQALMAFDAALTDAKGYVPALVGRGQSLLAMQRDDEALVAFEAALAADSSLTDLRRRVDVLRFRGVQDTIAAARAAAAAGRIDEARAAYRRAIDASPDSAFLHRDLGLIEETRNPDVALTSFRRALELDPGDVQSWVHLGRLLEARDDFEAAEAAYRKAADIDPSPELAGRIAIVVEKARYAKLPAEYKAIGESAQVTRGDLAALIGVRLEPILRTAPVRQAVVTDTRGYWAAQWVTAVVRAGVMEPFENHTFQPRTRLRRVELATAVSRLMTTIAQRSTAVRAVLNERPRIADMSPTHLSYPAVAAAVASGVVPLLDGQRFQVSRPVSGAEAIAAIERVRALAAAGAPLGTP